MLKTGLWDAPSTAWLPRPLHMFFRRWLLRLLWVSDALAQRALEH